VNYLGSGDLKDYSLKPTWAKKLITPNFNQQAGFVVYMYNASYVGVILDSQSEADPGQKHKTLSENN
jgi:hypothetical protein